MAPQKEPFYCQNVINSDEGLYFDLLSKFYNFLRGS